MIKVLIMDDEPDICEILYRRLTKGFACSVDIAEDVDKGIQMCKRKNYDIIFFDYLFLGDADGFSFLYNIKRKRKLCISVMISGYMKTMLDVIEKGLGVAPDEFIPKPFPDNAVSDIMNKYFTGSKL